MDMKGFYFNGKIWVRDEHSDAEAVSMTYLPELLKLLDLFMETPSSLITLLISSETYFDICYRCDFKAPAKPSSLNDSQPREFKPESISGCDLALPVKAREFHIYDFKKTDYLLLGLDPFAVVGDNNEIRVDNDWSNNHLTGKDMTSSHFLHGEPKPTYLYAGVLHGNEGQLLSRQQLDGWLKKMLQSYGKPNETFVVLAPVEVSGAFIGWFGLFQRAKGTGIGLQWEPLTTLVNDDNFWEALKETGEARNKPVEGIGDLFSE
ncbi:hypothetical protein J8655_19395 [Dickeya oryzae]|uniref:hypothetical protein n=1 Tax=Dickeya oryzae TaxID=1240404 RepID=UPI001AEC8D5E|nr:hypothetical protein [Dickeya oryzae]MBP2847606.1 hypothetical protein [Dickeya oryzae]